MKPRFNSRLPYFAALLGVTLLIGFNHITANAASLPYQGEAQLNGTTEAAQPSLAGVVIADNVIPFTIPANTGYTNPPITGMLETRVVKEKVSGYLDFYYRVLIQKNSVSLASLGFSTYLPTSNNINVNFRIDGQGVDSPIKAYRGSGGYSPNAITFAFPESGTVSSQASSRFIMVSTDATDYDNKGTTLMETFNAGHLTVPGTFEPKAIVNGGGVVHVPGARIP